MSLKKSRENEDRNKSTQDSESVETLDHAVECILLDYIVEYVLLFSVRIIRDVCGLFQVLTVLRCVDDAVLMDTRLCTLLHRCFNSLQSGCS